MRVLVAGFFDMLHAAHIAFLQRAAKLGPLTVVIGSNEAAKQQKGAVLRCSEAERRFTLLALACVERVAVPSEPGRLNFRNVLQDMLREGIVTFVVNEESDTTEKRRLCHDLGAEYLVVEKTLPEDVCDTHSTELRRITGEIPYRINLGGFFDQPEISRQGGGACVVFRVFSERPLEERSGAATSTHKAIAAAFNGFYPYWLSEIAAANLFFALENPPGHDFLSGTIDAIGLSHAGICRLVYAGATHCRDAYWPATVERLQDPDALRWLSSRLWLVQTAPRPSELRPILETARPSSKRNRAHGVAVDRIWRAIADRDVRSLGHAMNEAHDAASDLIGSFAPESVRNMVDQLRPLHSGVYLLGAGGGGYLAVLSPDRPENGIGITIA